MNEKQAGAMVWLTTQLRAVAVTDEQAAVGGIAKAARDWERLNAQREAEAAKMLLRVAPLRSAEVAIGAAFDAGSVCYRELVAANGELVVLSGGPGCGKTIAAVRAMYDYIADKKAWIADSWGDIRRRQSPSAKFVTAGGLSRASKYEEGVMDGILGPDLLVIDDLGSEYQDSKGAFLSLLDEVINERYSQKRRTIITTNLASQGFVERYGERVKDRIRECGAFIASIEKSRR